MSIVPTYPFDPTGLLASNLITNEVQIITGANWRDYHFIVPRLAPYFMDTMKILYTDTTGAQRYLVKDVDWMESHMFIAASRQCANFIYGSVSFLNTSLAGTVQLQYQTLGGSWVLDDVTISQILADIIHNPRITSWDEVANLPFAFPPIDHPWDLIDMTGAKDVVASLNAIEAQLRMTGQQGLSDHLADFNNPHKVNKAQVGLSLVNNFDIATVADAQAGQRNDVYLTPMSANALMQALFGVNLQNHLNDHNNPHQTTAAQVGAYTTQQVDTLLTGKLDKTAAAADSAKFNGMLPAEYAANVLTGTAANSVLFAGRSYLEFMTDVQGGPASNSLQLNGMSADQLKAWILSGQATDSLRFNGKLYSDMMNDVANATVLNAQNFNSMSYSQVKSDILSGTAAAAATFGGMTPANYAISVLQGTAANAALFSGMTLAQLVTYVGQNVVASNASQFGNMDVNAYKAFVLSSGQAADSALFAGKNPQDFANWVQTVSTASNSVQFNGMTPSAFVSYAENMMLPAHQNRFDGSVTVETARTNYQQLGSVLMISSGDPASKTSDVFWLVGGGASNGGTSSTLFLLTISLRNGPTGASPGLSVQILSGQGTGVSFGYNVVSGGSSTPASMNVYLVNSQNTEPVSVTDLTGGPSSVLTDYALSVTAPPNFIPVNGPFNQLANGADLQQLTTDVGNAFDSLTAAFTSLQQSITNA